MNYLVDGWDAYAGFVTIRVETAGASITFTTSIRGYGTYSSHTIVRHAIRICGAIIVDERIMRFFLGRALILENIQRKFCLPTTATQLLENGPSISPHSSDVLQNPLLCLCTRYIIQPAYCDRQTPVSLQYDSSRHI